MLDIRGKELIVRLYCRANALGYVPDFDEVDGMDDMPRANAYSTFFKSYDNAVGIVKGWLGGEPTKRPTRAQIRRNFRKLSQEQRDIWERNHTLITRMKPVVVKPRQWHVYLDVEDVTPERSRRNFLGSGWSHIGVEKTPFKGIVELLSESVEQADELGRLPDSFTIGRELSERLDCYEF